MPKAMRLGEVERRLKKNVSTSKHLKGRLGPRVSDVTFFGPKEVDWGPVLVT